MFWRVIIRTLGWLLVAGAVINLGSLVVPEVRDSLISLPSMVSRYVMIFFAGLGFALLRRWGLVVYIVGGVIQWILFFIVYGGVSQTVSPWVSAFGSIVVIVVTALNWRQLKW